MDTIIYGMGGGKMSDPRMTDHYRRIVDLAKAQFGIETPQVAIIPTAQFNGTHAKIGRGNMDFIGERFRRLGCDTQQILMGGDTRYLLEVVRGKGLVATIESIIHDGKVMAGTSAGFIWLTKYCMSDAESFHSNPWRYIMLQGLGILPVAGNAHDNGPLPEGLVPQVGRREQFEGYFAQLGEHPGIVVDEFAAIEVRNFICQPRSPDPAIGAHVLANGPHGIARRKIAPGTAVNLRNTAALRDFALSIPD